MLVQGCPSCGFGNAVAAKFCNDCGKPLNVKRCPHCSVVNASQASRCVACDTPFPHRPVIRVEPAADAVRLDPSPGTGGFAIDAAGIRNTAIPPATPPGSAAAFAQDAISTAMAEPRIPGATTTTMQAPTPGSGPGGPTAWIAPAGATSQDKPLPASKAPARPIGDLEIDSFGVRPARPPRGTADAPVSRAAPRDTRSTAPPATVAPATPGTPAPAATGLTDRTHIPDPDEQQPAPDSAAGSTTAAGWPAAWTRDAGATEERPGAVADARPWPAEPGPHLSERSLGQAPNLQQGSAAPGVPGDRVRAPDDRWRSAQAGTAQPPLEEPAPSPWVDPGPQRVIELGMPIEAAAPPDREPPRRHPWRWAIGLVVLLGLLAMPATFWLQDGGPGPAAAKAGRVWARVQAMVAGRDGAGAPPGTDARPQGTGARGTLSPPAQVVVPEGSRVIQGNTVQGGGRSPGSTTASNGSPPLPAAPAARGGAAAESMPAARQASCSTTRQALGLCEKLAPPSKAGNE